MNGKPFEITRWESSKEPTEESLARMMAREGLEPQHQEFLPSTRTLEMKFPDSLVRVVVVGEIQVAFPGYGVVALAKGDILEIEPGILHDITVIGQSGVLLLEAFRRPE